MTFNKGNVPVDVSVKNCEKSDISQQVLDHDTCAQLRAWLLPCCRALDTLTSLTAETVNDWDCSYCLGLGGLTNMVEAKQLRWL